MAHAFQVSHGYEPDVDGYFACVTLPAAAHAQANALAEHLDHMLRRLGLGRVTGQSATHSESEDAATTLTLSLISDAAPVLQQVADLLAVLHAPKGTTVGHAECPSLLTIPMRAASPLRPQARALRGSFGTSDRGGITLFAPHARQVARLLSSRAGSDQTATLH